tara:strand:+ start:14068 stop:14577 length:510 start_codon:yes stop_codon:yes gene_type:complete
MLKCNIELNRRDFLFKSASGVILLAFPSMGETAQKKLGFYPQEKIIQLARLRRGEVHYFEYPQKSSHMCILVRLDGPAGGGVGPHEDIVAFHTMCTHMGRQLIGRYNPEHKVLGPCPVHLSVFDLSRYGMLTSGQATQSLPQVILEHRDSWIVAKGYSQLLYGHHTNNR